MDTCYWILDTCCWFDDEGESFYRSLYIFLMNAMPFSTIQYPESGTPQRFSKSPQPLQISQIFAAHLRRCWIGSNKNGRLMDGN